MHLEERERLILEAIALYGFVTYRALEAVLPASPATIRRDLAPERALEIDTALRASVEYAFAHPDASREFVAQHAQEMSPTVVAQHIKLYVNDYTVALDEKAVSTLLDWAKQKGVGGPVSNLPVFV